MMTKQEFEACLEKHADEIERIRQSAHELHRSVNQTYGDGLPYSYHLDMVVSNVREFGHLVCASEEDVLPQWKARGTSMLSTRASARALRYETKVFCQACSFTFPPICVISIPISLLSAVRPSRIPLTFPSQITRILSAISSSTSRSSPT